MKSNCLQASHCDACLCQNVSSAVKRFRDLWSSAYGLNEDPFPNGIPPNLRDTLEDDICSMSPNVSKWDVSKAASKFLFRKALPAPMKASCVSDYFQKLTGNPQNVQEGFQDLASRLINDLFPIGWDSDYESYVRESVISSGASTEFTRKKGGAREYMRHVGLTGFEEACLMATGDEFVPDLRTVHVLLDNGKPRIVTIASGKQHFLSPLHHMMYDRLTKHGAVLRGDARASSFDGLKRDYTKKEDIYVSGDYSSATDNFNAGHSRVLLREISQNSRHVPKGIWDMAIDSLSGRIEFVPEAWDPPEWVKSVGYQLCGQMMGNYLSFPLLCITNLSTIYKAFGHEKARKMVKDGLVVINGDDIVFRCTKAEFDTWAKGVSECGLVLSPGKTICHKRIFSLNSTFFVATDKSIHMIPVLRSKSIIRQDKEFSPASFEGGLRSLLRGWSGEARCRIAACSLRLRMVEFGVIGNKGGPWGSLCRSLRKVPVNVVALIKSARQLVEREEEVFRSSLGFPAFADYSHDMAVERVGSGLDWLFEMTSLPSRMVSAPDIDLIRRTVDRAGRLRTWIPSSRNRKDEERERKVTLRYIKGSKKCILNAGVRSQPDDGEFRMKFRSSSNSDVLEPYMDRLGVDVQAMHLDSATSFRKNYLKYHGFVSFRGGLSKVGTKWGDISDMGGGERVEGPRSVLRSVRRHLPFVPASDGLFVLSEGGRSEV
nr:MAG: RNA-dependent RNA polymerase [Armillaria ostoyae ourmia-like virus 1]